MQMEGMVKQLKTMYKTTVRIFKEVFEIIPVISLLYALTYILQAIFQILNTYITAITFDTAYSVYEGLEPAASFYKYITIFLAVHFVRLMFGLLRGTISGYGLHVKGTNKFKIKLGEHVSKLSLAELEKPGVLNLLKQAELSISGNKATNTFFHIMSLISDGLTIIGVSAVLASFSVWLVPVAIISGIPSMAVRIIRGEKFYQLKSKQIPQARMLKYYWDLFLSPVHIKEMRSLGFTDYFANKWEKINMDVSWENWNFQKKDAFIMFIFDFFKVFFYGAGVAVSIILVYKNKITVGQFGACLSAFATVQYSIFFFIRVLSSYIGNWYFVRDYFTFLDIKPEQWGENAFNGITDKIEIKDVSFKYPNTDKNVLENINLMVHKGEKLAIIGENGSGKTTLSKIILGLYPVGGGTLSYNGKDIKEYNVSSFYSRISIVSQYFTKYFLTLRENIGISNTDELNDDGKITGVLKRTDIDEVLEKTEGLDGMMGREFGGTELSGGQWQKLAISRGLFKDYDFIVLDEPTSALDPIIETDIFTKFMEAMDDKTALIISHRVGFCRMADRIIVMKDGRIIEEGSHSELMNKKCYYYELFASQQAWYV